MGTSALPPIINRKVAAAMIALSVYGLLLIIISNQNININPVYVLTNIKNRYYIVNNGSKQKPPSTSTVRALQLETVIVRNVTPSGIATSRENSSLAAIAKRILDLTHSTSTTVNSMEASSTEKTTTSGKQSTAKKTAKTTTKTTTAQHTTTTVTTEQMTTSVVESILDKDYNPEEEGPILTMFTTFKNSGPKEHIYKNTIRNWERLKPWVKPILYYLPGEKNLVKFAKAHGWEVMEVPKLSRAKVPILRHMFLKARETHTTPFYCYTNGDILFDDGLIKTLRVLKPVTEKMKQVLIVGRRTNFKLAPGQVIDSFDDIRASAKKGQLFGTNAQDYFISTTRGYPWNTIPDFVVGRVGYDNWLVVTAIVKKMVVIDTTKTVIALHQTGSDGNFAGHSKKSSGDTYINYNLAGKKFDYSLGHVTCGQLLTEKDKTKVVVKERDRNGCEKMYRRRNLSPYVHLPKRRRLL